MTRLVKSTGSFSPLASMSCDALVRGVAAGEHLAVEQQRLARLPASRLPRASACRGRRASRVGVGRPVHVGPVGEVRRLELRRARAVEHEVRVARRGAVRDHRDRLGRRVRRVVEDLDVEHGGQAAQALRADAERVDLVVELDAQLLDAGSAGRAPCSSCMSIGSISASLASSIAFSAVPPMPMPSMPGGHQPAPIVGTVLSTQSTIESRRIEHHELATCSPSRRPWPRRHVDRVAGHELACGSRPACCPSCSCASNCGIGERSRRAACCRGRGRRGARLR